MASAGPARGCASRLAECAGQHGKGKEGLLELVLERGHGGKTIVSRQAHESPLFSQRMLHPDPDGPGLMYMMSSSGGIVQGDRYKTSITLRLGARACIATQGATRVYGMSSGFASHDFSIRLERGAYLELVPHQIIPYRSSRYAQSVECVVHDEAAMLYSEVIAPGRASMGESFEYDSCRLRTVVRNQDGRLRLADAADLQPRLRPMPRFGVLGRHTVAASAYVLAEPEASRKVCEGACGMAVNGTVLGASLLPRDSGVLVRMLGRDAEQVHSAISMLADIVRSCVRQAA